MSSGIVVIKFEKAHELRHGLIKMEMLLQFVWKEV